MLGGGEQEYVIQEGDTLTDIANKSGMSVDELAKLNDISNKDQIFVGNKLKIPTKGGTNPLIKAIGNPLGFGGADDLKEAYGLETQVDSKGNIINQGGMSTGGCLLYTSPSPRDGLLSRMPSSA